MLDKYLFVINSFTSLKKLKIIFDNALIDININK